MYQKSEKYNIKKTENISKKYAEILSEIGEDTSREGLEKTPIRCAKAIQFLTQGYHANPDKILKSALFHEEYNQMVLIKNIELYSLCEHHLVPFFGKAHIAYIPNKKIVGLSKIPRIVDIFSRRLQVQERLTQEISACLAKNLEPKGVAIVIEASHLCMQMRGVEKQNSITTTSSFTGIFLEEDKTRSEFMNLIQSKLA
ncbi:MAG: GTP cyclohydrolase I FolE [Flavobacteriales bacterium]|jgi:GTP cyclohydrolase I|nr:GTP cyclohydrolase I FolE [Flavobacteriales bacterium]|tara:strand:+ start:2786 stop:3382 length:597 start_codon:yes stop_codon:yes gene_type:complete